jgi:hypothetical protein
MEKAPKTEQECYDLGYSNPARSPREFSWQHLTDVNAYRCGQLDRQNYAPRNQSYRREEYDPETFELIPPSVELGDDENTSPEVPYKGGGLDGY